LGFDDGAALALVVALVVFDADADVLGAVLVSEPQPDSTTARAAAMAVAPEIAVDFIRSSCLHGVCRSEA
jgi:hypothetical protein